MSDYCTGCKYLYKETNANKTQWYCTRSIQWTCYPQDLQSSYGNPTKLSKCKEYNWFKSKQEKTNEY